jgi:hypothetical protein
VHDAAGNLIVPARKHTPTLFKKGDPRPEGAGRKKGQINRVTRELKDAIMSAAAIVGHIRYEEKENAKGQRYLVRVVDGLDGLEGYMKFLAIEHPSSFTSLLRAVLPYHISGTLKAELNMPYRSTEEVREALRDRGFPVDKLLLQHKNEEPTPVRIPVRRSNGKARSEHE